MRRQILSLFGELPKARVGLGRPSQSAAAHVTLKKVPNLAFVNGAGRRQGVRNLSNSTKKASPAPPSIGNSKTSNVNTGIAALALGVSASAAAIYSFRAKVGYAEAVPVTVSPVSYDQDSIKVTLDTTVDHDEKGFRTIRLAELSQHDRTADAKWVVHGTSVYDVTSFVDSHPGGEVILRACGGSIDPYWKIFSIHQKPEVRDILEELHIGAIDSRDLDSKGNVNWASLGLEQDIGDPFKDDPERDAKLVTHTARPCNAETPGSLLTDFLTPLHLFFVRNHLWVPRIEPNDHTVTIELLNGDETTLSLAGLRSKFKEHTITATMQCAGNRRAHMSSCATGKTAGLQWEVGAIGTAEFTGVRLRDVLRESGCDLDSDCTDDFKDKHVHFTSPGDSYAASIPLLTALSPTADVLLAYKMNGAEMPRDHGGPLRAIVPGTVAARSVKWVGKVSIADEEASSQWQRNDYKCFGPNVRAADVCERDWEEGRSIQELPVQSAITAVRNNNEAGRTEVRGYAVSGGGRGIVRVDVSADGGKTWKQADLHVNEQKGTRNWAWTLWSIEVPKGSGSEFVVKAVDEAYNSQPECFDATWNFRGLLGTAWHRVKSP